MFTTLQKCLLKSGVWGSKHFALFNNFTLYFNLVVNPWDSYAYALIYYSKIIILNF